MNHTSTIIQLLYGKGVTEVVVAFSDHSGTRDLESIVERNKGKIKIHLYEETIPRGTAGFLKNVMPLIGNQQFLLIYSNLYIEDINLKDLLNFHKKKKSAATVALASGFEVRVGLADLEKEGKIRGFIEKPKLEKPVSIGLLTFEGSALKDAQSLTQKKEELDLMGDIIPYLINQDKAVYGYLSESFWYDIGSTEAYEKLNKDKLEESMSFLF